MSDVKAVRPLREVVTRQKLPYFVGISGETVGARGLSMHMVVIPPGARAEPHAHRGYETGIYVLEGRVETRWGERLEHRVVSEPPDSSSAMSCAMRACAASIDVQRGRLR